MWPCFGVAFGGIVLPNVLTCTNFEADLAGFLWIIRATCNLIGMNEVLLFWSEVAFLSAHV